MDDHFCYLLRVRYCECDAQKVVFNGRYVDYVDIAATQFLEAVWGSYNDLMARGIDFQVVNLSISWKSPARYNDILEIRVIPVKTGTTSFSLDIKLLDYKSQRLVAEVQIIYVLVTAKDHNKMAMPREMKNLFKTGAKGVTIDHAGAMPR